MQYCQSWEQRLQFWVLLIQEHLFLPHFLFSSYIPLLWSYAHTRAITSNLSTWWLCHVSSFHLFMLLLFHLFCSHDSSSSQLEVIFVSPILNTQTYKTSFSHSCLSIYSHLPFNCEHHEGSDGLVTWSFSLHCGPFKPSSKVFSLVFFARCRNERISSSQSVILQQNYILLPTTTTFHFQNFVLLLVYVTLSSVVLLLTS